MTVSKLYGLIGTPLSHSFSRKYFSEKFKRENIFNCSYELFELESIDKLTYIVKKNESLQGLNVTIPYKESVLQHLDEIDPIAASIGAVNTLKIDPKNQSLKGFNTDYYGFKQSLKPFVNTSHQRALILGTGGSSKAVHYVLKELNIDCLFVSRTPKGNHEISYNDVNEYVIKHHQIIINTTPLGMFPHIDKKPSLPYQYLSESHLLYDLTYNPKETSFLKEGIHKNCICLNGYQMLILQAEKSWEIWNS